jgi:hypothetical protein
MRLFLLLLLFLPGCGYSQIPKEQPGPIEQKVQNEKKTEVQPVAKPPEPPKQESKERLTGEAFLFELSALATLIYSEPSPASVASRIEKIEEKFAHLSPAIDKRFFAECNAALKECANIQMWADIRSRFPLLTQQSKDDSAKQTVLNGDRLHAKVRDLQQKLAKLYP